MKNIYFNKDFFDQKVLNKIEQLCTQEDLPACSSTCPVHLDVKNIILFIEKNDFKSAFNVFKKNLIFPKIIAYGCDAPCELKCKRITIGGAIQINDLEKSIIKYGYEEFKKSPILIKKKYKNCNYWK